MAQQKYLVQLKLPSWNLYGGYSAGEEIAASGDDEAIDKGREHRLGQDETGFRVLKVVYESA